MKANAPEKIFICNYGSELSYEWHSESEFETKGDDDIEYIRTDAFIKKACEWLNKELPITDLSPSNMLDIAFKVFDKECKKVFIEDFKKYMKGE